MRQFRLKKQWRSNHRFKSKSLLRRILMDAQYCKMPGYLWCMQTAEEEPVISSVGVPCEICGTILIIHKGSVPEEEIDTPPLCGKCYYEYYPEYQQSLRTGYRL